MFAPFLGVHLSDLDLTFREGRREDGAYFVYAEGFGEAL